MNNTNRLLAVLLAAQVVLGVWAFWPRESVDNRGLLFVDREEADIVTLAITDGDGKTIEFSNTGGEWVLPEADAFPADGDRIAPLLRKIAQLRTDRMVTVTDGSHSRLQVGEQKFNRKLQITWSDGVENTLLLGSTAGAGATHFRMFGRDEVYLTADLNPWETNTAVSNYIDTQFFSVPKEAVIAINLQNENGIFNFTKVNEEWKWEELDEDQVLDESALNSLLLQVSSVRMMAPVGKELQPSYGLEQPQATAIIVAEMNDARQEHVLRVGSELDGEFLFSASGAEYYVTISSYTAGNLIDKTYDDFVQAPPE